jgi:DNA-binding PadR family transcriptional regulator
MSVCIWLAVLGGAVGTSQVVAVSGLPTNRSHPQGGGPAYGVVGVVDLLVITGKYLPVFPLFSGMASTAETATFSQLIKRTRGTPRARIIDGLRFYEGECNAKRLRKEWDIPSGTYHFDELEEQGLIKSVGEEYVGRGGSSTVYQLTDRGWEVNGELVDSDAVGLTELINRVEKQAAAIKELQEQVGKTEDLQQDVDHLGNLYNDVAEHVESLDAKVNQ